MNQSLAAAPDPLEHPAALPFPMRARGRHRDLDEIVSDFRELGGYARISEADGSHLAISLSHELAHALTERQQRRGSREQILEQIEPARAVYAESPFVRRLQTWPRGYAGDFETIEYLLQQQNHAEPGRFAYWLERYALDSAIAQQHRNKVDLQARAIVDAALVSSTPEDVARILVLAAGGSPDLRQVQTLLSTSRAHIVLLDQDPDALAFSAEQLPLLRERLSLLNRNVVRGLQDARRFGPYSLVVAGGLFDYLPDRMAVLVLRQIRERLLHAGGRVLFTNITEPNPYRYWIEYVGEWCLIHRSESEVRTLCHEAGFADESIEVKSDRTGLARIVTGTAS
ncbi:MAG: class I SAM-dependent methyltransferase [Acidobacteriota bacterium]